MRKKLYSKSKFSSLFCGESLVKDYYFDRIHQERIPILFYRNDHTPIYVHVKRGDPEAVFVVEGEIVLRESVGMKTSELAKAENIPSEHQ